MPYSTRYILNQLARGRPMPTGSPEHDLFHALERLSHMDVARALRSGASASAYNARGQSAPEALVSAASRESGAWGLPRAVLCLEELLRAGRPVLPHGPRGVDVLVDAAHVMERARDEQVRWFRAWERLARDRRWWNTPGSRGVTAMQAWRENAQPGLAGILDRTPLATRPTKSPRM